MFYSFNSRFYKQMLINLISISLNIFKLIICCCSRAASFARYRVVRAHSRFDSCVSRTVVRVVLWISRVPFTHIVARRVRASSRDDHVCRTRKPDNK
jgi:hypothetical protein